MLKRRVKSKLLFPFVMLLMTLSMSAFAGLRDESWSVNPSDFRYDMSLYFRMENVDFEDLSSFEIGAFVEDECRGLAEKLELTHGESCLYMRIRSNKADGEKLNFYMKDKKTGQVVIVKGADGSELTFKADSRVGLPSDPWLMSPYYTAVFKIDGEIIQTLEVGYADPIVVPEVPAKEGYTFNGWGDVPAVMPPYGIEFNGTYTVNSYSLTFMLDEEVFYSAEVAYGSTIIVPDVPAKDGYSFSGWSSVPETMPAGDLVIRGNYDLILYNVVYKVDGEAIHVDKLNFGDIIPVWNAVPEKEGYTFSGWPEIPETMPARDVEINGSYNINHYTISFSIADEVFVSQVLAYGEEIIVPNAPAKEGYTFSGWNDVPEAMPAKDLEFKGDYAVNSYTVIFRIDQYVFKTIQLEYGADISVPQAPDMEGHTFSGWGDVPATMPAYDLVFVGTYADNYYTVTFKIGDEVIKMADLAYGAEIILPEVPEKEGHSFSGWGDVPPTMPASNIEINGSYTVNTYVITFKIDDDVIYTGILNYGADVTSPQAPGKDGYSFSGWGIVPEVMPASDLVISGTYIANTYTLSFLIDGELYYTTQTQYGSEISAPEFPLKEGYTLIGWNDVPATMPAYDLNINGTYTVNSYVLTFKIDDEVIFSGEIPYGSEVIAPEAPAKDGYAFSGWGMVPTFMPASDLELTGTYEVKLYNVTFIVDGEVILTTAVPYGGEIVAPFLSEKDGYSFSGWGELPSSMPANDVVLTGTYSVNYYLLTFKIGEDVIFSGEFAYGADITVPTAPEKEGYTFRGWGDVPVTMPSRNLECFGTYEPNLYSLTFKIGNDVIYDDKVIYGAEISVPDVPEKEGHSFTGWGVVPSVMPAQDLVFTGSYEINSYSIVFKIDEEIFYSAQLSYGSELTVPDVPEKEGYSFTGWGIVPKTVPARDLEFTGSYKVNVYNVIFKIGDEVISKSELAYGADIVVPEVPEKEGYTFSGWGIVPNTMPASDLQFTGKYDINYYTVTFKINDEIVYTSFVAYGEKIVVPEAPEHEGCTFSGWNDVPDVMPAKDLEFNSTYTAKIYHAVFTIDGEIVATLNVPFNSVVIAPEAPDKEGYTFTGWIDVPETMPAHDIDIKGAYEINHYRLVVYLDKEIYMDEELAYGADIVIPTPEVEDGMQFDGWKEEVPATMPAHDVEIHGTISAEPTVGVVGVCDESQVTVITLDGVVLYKDVKTSDIKERLTPGVYIINGKKTVIK